jgi:hypothetical protein
MSKYAFVRVIHNPKNLGIGASFIKVINMAKYDRLTIFAGDNNVSPYLIEKLFKSYRAADLVTSYTMNTEVRGRLRNFLSMVFSTIYCTTFDIHVKYINGNPVYPVNELKKLDIRSQSYSVLAEVNIKLLRRGITYYEVEGYVNPDSRKSSALRVGSFIEVILTYLRLVYVIYIKERSFYSLHSTRIGLPDGLDADRKEPSPKREAQQPSVLAPTTA